MFDECKKAGVGRKPVHGLDVLALDDLAAAAAAIAVEGVEVGHAQRPAVPLDELLQHPVAVAALEAVVMPWLALMRRENSISDWCMCGCARAYMW